MVSVQWGDGFRRLMGYRDQSDFPNELESFVRGVYPEDRDTLFRDLDPGAFDEDAMKDLKNIWRKL